MRTEGDSEGALNETLWHEINAILAEHSAFERGERDSPFPTEVPDFRDPVWKRDSAMLMHTLRSLAYERIVDRQCNGNSTEERDPSVGQLAQGEAAVRMSDADDRTFEARLPQGGGPQQIAVPVDAGSDSGEEAPKLSRRSSTPLPKAQKYARIAYSTPDAVDDAVQCTRMRSTADRRGHGRASSTFAEVGRMKPSRYATSPTL